MIHLFNFLVIGLLLVNLAGLSVWVMHLSRLPYGLAKALTVVGGTLGFFFVEHFIGLGALGWLLPVMTFGAFWGLWKHGAALWEESAAEIAFLAAFGYALIWRYMFPNIDPSSEKLADLSFIAGYLQGARLPAPDLWLHSYALTQYYSFQHYGAALLGRIMDLQPGTAYNLGHCVVVGIVLAAACDFVRVFTKRRWAQILILATLLLGGTGACLVTPFTVKNEQTFSSMRFIGSSNVAGDNTLTPAGIWLRKLQYGDAPADPVKRESILELPMEIFSYVVHLGDYHAPLGGYALLAMALAAFGVLLGKPDAVPRCWATGVLAGTVPLCIAANTWVFPLQAMLVAGCLVFLWRYREPPRWEELIGTGAITWILLYPYLTYFLAFMTGAATKPELVQPGQHAPLLSYLIQMWPFWGLAILAWFAPAKGRREYRWFAIAVACFLVAVEMMNIDDLYSGRFQRFNTTLKWWPWVGALALLLLAPLNLADGEAVDNSTDSRKTKSSPRGAAIPDRPNFPRIGTVLILLGMLYFTVKLGREWSLRPRTAVGQLDGAAWLRQDAPDPGKLSVSASILNYLSARPEGVILEAPAPDHAMAFTETGAVSLFTGHPTVVGWPAHEQLWRGYQRDIEQRWNNVNEFFRGELHAPLDFLLAHNVRFILWPGSKEVDPALFDKIKEQIESQYRFVRFDKDQTRKGIWERK